MENRSQVVRVSNNDSSLRHLASGIPQGLVLGLLLFPIYIQPLGALIEQHSIQYKFYADDLQVFYSFNYKIVDEAINKLESCAHEIYLWLLHNMLSLNADKSKQFLLGTTTASQVPQFCSKSR